MLIFCGFDIQLFVEDVLDRQNGPTLCRARDEHGDQWLIVQVDDNPAHLAWLCVPVSERAIQAIVNGRSDPRDAICHSATGTVDLVIIDHGRAVPDSCLVCSSIPEHLLPAARRRLVSAA